MGSLSRQLFEEDPEHEAYWGAVSDVLQSADRSAIPDIARQISMNHLQHMQSLTGGDFERWIQDLAESFADAYVLADEEEWDVEAEAASELIDQCMVNINRARLAVGSDAITRADYSTWVSLVLLGLQTDMDEWRPLNDYVRSSGAWDRLEWVFPPYLMIGQQMSQPRSDELEQWQTANLMAWRDGVFLSLLYRLGLLSTEVGARGFGDGDRPLSGTLFELDPRQYQMTAAQLMQATAHAVPDVAKELYWHLIGPLVDQKLARNYGQWLRDTFESGYVLCLSEAWEGLDEDTLDELIDEGLRTVIREKDSRDPDILLADPEYRIRNVSYGIAGGMPYFTRLTQYLEGQEAFQRIAGLGEMMLTGVAASGAIKRRHAAKLESPLRLSFLLGVSVALLDQLGEVPPEMPARLP